MGDSVLLICVLCRGVLCCAMLCPATDGGCVAPGLCQQDPWLSRPGALHCDQGQTAMLWADACYTHDRQPPHGDCFEGHEQGEAGLNL